MGFHTALLSRFYNAPEALLIPVVGKTNAAAFNSWRSLFFTFQWRTWTSQGVGALSAGLRWHRRRFAGVGPLFTFQINLVISLVIKTFYATQVRRWSC